MKMKRPAAMKKKKSPVKKHPAAIMKNKHPVKKHPAAMKKKKDPVKSMLMRILIKLKLNPRLTNGNYRF